MTTTPIQPETIDRLRILGDMAKLYHHLGSPGDAEDIADAILLQTRATLLLADNVVALTRAVQTASMTYRLQAKS